MLFQTYLVLNRDRPSSFQAVGLVKPPGIWSSLPILVSGFPAVHLIFRDDCLPKYGCYFGKFPNGPCPPPPRPFLEITLRFFSRKFLSMRKFAMKFFELAMTPPPLPPFWTFFQNLRPKYTALKPTKSAM